MASVSAQARGILASARARGTLAIVQANFRARAVARVRGTLAIVRASFQARGASAIARAAGATAFPAVISRAAVQAEVRSAEAPEGSMDPARNPAVPAARRACGPAVRGVAASAVVEVPGAEAVHGAAAGEAAGGGR